MRKPKIPAPTRFQNATEIFILILILKNLLNGFKHLKKEGKAKAKLIIIQERKIISKSVMKPRKPWNENKRVP